MSEMAILNENGVDGGVEEVVEEEGVRVLEEGGGGFARIAAAGLLRWVQFDEIEEAQLVGDRRRLHWLHHFLLLLQGIFSSKNESQR